MELKISLQCEYLVSTHTTGYLLYMKQNCIGVLQYTFSKYDSASLNGIDVHLLQTQASC
jgi:hypothetical protein